MKVLSFSLNPLTNDKRSFNLVYITELKATTETSTFELHNLLENTLKLFGYETTQMMVHWSEKINITDQGDAEATFIVNGLIDQLN
ncbi:hypothetical protein [Paenibacillus taichungensis]